EGRGYTLRRIIRRAIRHGNKLGASEPFFYRLVEVLIDAMGEAYPELKVSRKQVEQILLQEEEQFSKTLDKGMKVLESDIASLDSTVISGATVFTLYDTYGFPVDLTNDIARERGLTLDHEGYEAAMETQRERARASSKFGVDYNDSLDISGSTEFVGYESFDHESEVLSVTVDGENAKAGAGEQCIVVLASTPFYAESGGQAGDTGVLEWDGGKALVKDTQKQENHFLHICQIESGELSSGVSVKASIDSVQRDATALNHSATHLLHAALRQILGEHVVQKGSLCNGERLRFDFAHYEAVTPEQLLEIESMVNARIRENSLVTTTLTDIKTAKQMGAMALFGEKYGENVRVLSMGDDNFSVELCGGTHAQRTGDIGSLVIVSEGGISSGVRRIEALSGAEAEAWNRESQAQLKNVASVFKAGREDVLEKANQWVEKCRALEKELEVFKQKAAADAGSQLADKAVDVAGVKVVAAQLSGVDRKGLEDAVDKLKNQFENAVVLLASVDGDKIALVAGVTKSISKQYKAGDLMKVVAAGVGGKGGGRPDFAKGGGTDVTALEETLASVAGWVESQQ
ncbi:alanine--tRNA ligase, partial [Oleiphilus sp. HI0117]